MGRRANVLKGFAGICSGNAGAQTTNIHYWMDRHTRALLSVTHWPRRALQLAALKARRILSKETLPLEDQLHADSLLVSAFLLSLRLFFLSSLSAESHWPTVASFFLTSLSVINASLSHSLSLIIQIISSPFSFFPFFMLHWRIWRVLASPKW